MQMLDDLRDAGSAIAERADEVEAARRLPPDLLEVLRAAGCFRMLVPVTHGGVGLDLVDSMRVLERLAMADASVAWTVWIGAATPVLFRFLARADFDEMYAAGPDVITGGSFTPSGTAERADGGYRVTGQWSFASGCEHSHWLFAHCAIDSGEELVVTTLPAAEVDIKDTWTVSGLCGTGSHDFVANQVFVPTKHTFPLLSDTSCLPGPLSVVPTLSLLAAQLGSIATGIARAALDDVVALADHKVPFGRRDVLARDELFQHQLGRAETKLRAARSLLHADADRLWRPLSGVPTNLDRAQLRATVSWAIVVAVAAVEMAYTAAGGTAVYATSPLQRRLRDIKALTQHVLARTDTHTTAGALLAGEEPDLTLV